MKLGEGMVIGTGGSERGRRDKQAVGNREKAEEI